MTAAAIPSTRTRFPAPRLLLGVIIAAVILLSLSHAVDRHGSEALSVRQCHEDKGALKLWHPDKKRCAYLVELEDEGIGVRITKLVRVAREGVREYEITAYRLSRQMDDYIQLMIRRGFVKP